MDRACGNMNLPLLAVVAMLPGLAPLHAVAALSQDSLGLVEVADAVCEDAREGVMGIDEDGSFRKALFGVARVRGL